MAKAKKKRAEKYDPKLKIEGNFEDVIDLSLNYTPEDKKKTKPQKKPKK
jgi:hypothetical protein